MSEINTAEIKSIIEQKIQTFQAPAKHVNQGTIISIQDGIIQIYGLNEVMSGEMIDCGSNCFAIALNLEKDVVGAVVLGPYSHLQEGQIVKTTGRVLEVPTGASLLGRVVDALGNPIDGLGIIAQTQSEPIEKIAPGVIHRQSVTEPLQTGITAIDSMTPIGRGQRELIIGDRQTGKTSIAIDTIINQKDTGVKCIYVAIGQKASSVAQLVQTLKEHDALKHTIIVSASAADTASLQYIAPYSGCTMGEFFRDRGEDALIIYDDLSKHAVAYRQIALLLRRPPGREAFPGDIFYLHSRLLERAARVNTDYIRDKTQGKVQDKTGSLTALPIVETQAGDVSAFVPTNVISITDGQIFLDTDLFNAGCRPAINSGLSVSRVGGAAQTKIIKKLGGGVRISLAQFRELEAFSQFASDLDDTTKKQLHKGQVITELMKQGLYNPLSVAEMAIILLLGDKNILAETETHKVYELAERLRSHLRSNHKDILDKINKNPVIDEQLIEKCTTILSDYIQGN
ncbi:MAG: F0F1 ATP synthase subunit alpha [Pseudomonadota bacterium]|nr:F0F1 ATP synthase subunit alpha [Pseudomonadota bacterium]